VTRVQILEKSVAERIAAGEVVERPVSIVKELVENSLDAAASRITIELQGGGSTLIRVTDDGHGMSEADVRLAVQRFATSKIRQWEDLDELVTLGFRGEALPSIAAVARVEIQTCEPDAEHGTELRIEGSETLRVAPVAGVPGTRITVRDLFYNTPARRKFLRSPAAETAQVADLVGRLAAAWPEVHFRLTSNGKELFSFPAGLPTAERLSRLWKVPSDRLVPIQGQGEGLLVDGLVALPPEARSTRAAQIFLMNGRVIRSNALSQALVEGFSPLLERGRFPVGLVRLTVDPSQVDVNVHPTKLEVRFARPRPVFSTLFRAVANALETRGADPVQPRHLERALDSGTWEQTGSGEGSSPRSSLPPPRPSLPPPPTQAVLEFLRPLQDQEGEASEKAARSDRVGEPVRPRFVPLAQLHDTFLVGLVDGDLWLIDQHTAHERVNYERLGHLAPMGERSQGLLVPEVLEFPPPLAEFLGGHLEDFRELGFEVEPFGGDAFQLRGVPVGLPARRVLEAFRALVEEAAEGGVTVRGTVQEGFRERLRAMVSCKAAVKSGDPLTHAEMTRLVHDMLEVEHSRYCPHGRPTRILLDRRALERLFHR